MLNLYLESHVNRQKVIWILPAGLIILHSNGVVFLNNWNWHVKNAATCIVFFWCVKISPVLCCPKSYLKGIPETRVVGLNRAKWILGRMLVLIVWYEYLFFYCKNSPIRGWGGLSKMSKKMSKMSNKSYIFKQNWIISIRSRFIWYLVI